MSNRIKLFLRRSAVKINETFDRNENVYFFLIFLICVGIHLYISSIGWSNVLQDQHGFRQTQTALSTFFATQEGFKLNYITPVLGPPWSIPMEFPLFQWIVALVVFLFKTPLDQTGRFVSLIFFYFSLIPLYFILDIFVRKKTYKLIVLSLILLNPIYLFWSRTFMIESLALFLVLLSGWLMAKNIQTARKSYVICAIAAGSLAALVKITTFIAIAIPFLFIFIYFWKREDKLFSKKILSKYFATGLLIFGIPLLSGMLWTHFADEQKNLNPLASNFITSSSLTDWNFGTLTQRLQYKTWDQIFEYSLIPPKLFGETNYYEIMIPNMLLFILLFMLFARGYRLIISLLFLSFLIGPLIFTNLYYVHSYYLYANNFFISIILGLCIVYILREAKRFKLFASLVFFPFILISSVIEYGDYYYPSQKMNDTALVEPANFIKRNTNTDDIVLIYGQDWDPTIPYYSQRKSIMDRKNLSLENSKIKTSIANLKDEKISAVVFPAKISSEFLSERINYFNLRLSPSFTNDNLSIYLKK